MEQILRQIGDWCKKHSVTTFFIVVHLILSTIYMFIPVEKSFFQLVINAYMVPDMSIAAINVIFSLLFSGVELSVGSLHYGLWLLFSSCFLFCFRSFFLKKIPFLSSIYEYSMFGPTYIVFAVYLTFIFIHRPLIYFKIFGKIRFTDTSLYSIAVLQYMIYKLPDHFFDFISCVISNIIWKFVNSIISYIERREQQENRNADEERGTQLQL